MTIYYLIPMYNEEENVEVLIKLIEEQGPKNYKIIVVNDGSTDDTLHILKRLSKSYPIIIVNHAKNQGLSVTMKDVFLAGIKYAKPGDIFITLDGDMSHNKKSKFESWNIFHRWISKEH